MKQLKLAALFVGLACSSQAGMIKFFDDPALIDFLLDGAVIAGVNFPNTSGTSIVGTATGVGNITFTGDEQLQSASGNALVEGVDGGFDVLEISGPFAGFSIITFSLYPESKTPFSGSVTVTYVPPAGGGTFVDTFTIGTGRNEFLLYSADAATFITNVEISTSADLKSIKQVGVGNAGPPPNDVLIPEPASYALFGTGIVLLFVRRGQRR